MSDPKPNEYPFWRYKKGQEPVLVQSDEDWNKLDDGWFDSPAKSKQAIGIIRLSNGLETIGVLSEDSPDAPPSKENLALMSEDELRGILIGMGSAEKKLKGKSKTQLLGMFEG